MRRFATIALIAAVVLTMSVGTAFATTCVGMKCSSSRWRCAETGAASCPMDQPGSSLHSACQHGAQRDSKDAVNAQAPHDDAVAALPAPPTPAVTPLSVAAAPAAPDARGAPHLTAVIRI